MECGSSGLAYFAFTTLTSTQDVGIQAYEVYEAAGIQIPLYTIIVIIVATVIIIGALGGIVRFKRREANVIQGESNTPAEIPVSL